MSYNLCVRIIYMKHTIIALFFLLVACDGDVVSGPSGPGIPPPSNDWLIPVNQVFEATGRDGIPALSNPNLIAADEAGYMFDPEFVIGYFDGEQAVAFPHHILDWHEIINIRIGVRAMAITYCPLTGTGIGWPQVFSDFESEFAVSGLLYNNNLIAFDRNTGSNWSQASLMAVNGPKIGTEVTTIPLVETRWSTWLEMFPNTKVVSRDTGVDRPYGTYPYGDFRSDHDDLFFPLTFDDRRLPRKERLMGVLINGQVKTYRFSSFDTDNKLILDSFQGEDLVVVGNAAKNFMVAFFSTLSFDSSPNFTAIDEGKAIIADENGNKWDIFGQHIAGPNAEDLTSVRNFMGYWFAWGAFYPTPEIFEF